MASASDKRTVQPNVANVISRKAPVSNNWKSFLIPGNKTIESAKVGNRKRCRSGRKKSIHTSGNSKINKQCHSTKTIGTEVCATPRQILDANKIPSNSHVGSSNQLLDSYNSLETKLQEMTCKTASARPAKQKLKKDLLTKFVAIDCEMVEGEQQKDMLARISIVNSRGQCIYDKFVKPTEPVIDYRTQVSGVRPKDLEKGDQFAKVQKEVADILKGRVVVGHALHNDFKVLLFSHPKKNMRDTSRCQILRRYHSKGGTPSLKKLAYEALGVRIQEGEHNSVDDARAAMKLYIQHRREWELMLHERKRKKEDKTAKVSIDSK